MNDMHKLVKVDDCGNFGVPGIHMIEVPNELYSCVCKLNYASGTSLTYPAIN